MPTIRAYIQIDGDDRSCDRAFSDLKNQFRGVFDTRDTNCNRQGTRLAGSSQYVFFCDCTHNDAPIILGFLRDTGFHAQYV